MDELSDAVWNFAALPDFGGPIWSGRLARPAGGPESDRVFLADAIELVARTYPQGEPEVCLKQAAIDIALHAKRGDLSTSCRNQVGGAWEMLDPTAWAEWFAADELPRIIAECASTTHEPHGRQKWWVFVDNRGLSKCFPGVSPAAKPVLPEPIVPLRGGYQSAVPKTWPDEVPDPDHFDGNAGDAAAIFRNGLWSDPLRWPEDRKLGGSAWADTAAVPYVFVGNAIEALARHAPAEETEDDARLWAGKLIVKARIAENLHTRFYLDGRQIDARLDQWRAIAREQGELAPILADCGARQADGSTLWLFVDRHGLDGLIAKVREAFSAAHPKERPAEGWRVRPGEDLRPWAIRAESDAKARIVARSEEPTHTAIAKELEEMAARSGVAPPRVWKASSIGRALQDHRQAQREGAKRAPRNAP